MPKYVSGLLSCSFCGEDIEYHGKDGAILQTKCPHCGMSSDMLTDEYLNENSQQVEVYYNRKAPVSTTPPSG